MLISANKLYWIRKSLLVTEERKEHLGLGSNSKEREAREAREVKEGRRGNEKGKAFMGRLSEDLART